jgi:hypothetical protein
MHVLLMRAFPGWYKFNSIYAMYPFSHPDRTREVLTKIKTISNFSFEKPQKPTGFLGPMDYISNYHACIKVLNDQESFKMAWGPAIKELTGTEYMLSGDTKALAEQHVKLHDSICGPGVKGGLQAIWDFFESTTLDLIKRSAFKLGGFSEMDAVREYSLALATS